MIILNLLRNRPNLRGWIALSLLGSAIGVGAATVSRGPYLQNGSHQNLTVRWRTDAVTDSVVRYGTNLANLDLVTSDAASVTEHEIRLTALLPDTTYFYSVGSTDATLAGSNANHFFVTAPLPGTPKPTRIWVLGDSGTGTVSARRVRDAYDTNSARHTDLWLMLGDNAYPEGTDAEYQTTLFDMYPNMLRKSVLWPTLGNHDTASSTAFVDTYPYFDIFTLPKNGEAGGIASGTEHYYSFDYGNIHFICLDSMTASRATNGAMYNWLIYDLANVTADWTIAFWHHPPYSRGSHNSDFDTQLIEMRQVFLPVLEQVGVDLVLAGHSHSYERSFLLDQHYGFASTLNATNKLDAGSGREGDTGAYKKPEPGPLPHLGTVYVVAGSAGETQNGQFNHPAMYIKGLRKLGSLVLDIAGDRLDAMFLREDGTTNDFFTIVKSNRPPVLEPIADQVVDANQSLVLTNFARDFVLPGEELDFSLLSAPTGASIHNLSPTNAVFSWVPACAQGGTTNLIIVQVSDHGTPSLTATQTFHVIVPDCVQVRLGNAVVRAGDTVSVPVDLLSTVPLSNVVLLATYPAERFTNGTLLINTQQVAAAPLFNLPGTGLLDVGLEFQTNHTLRLSTNVATLGFTTFSNQSSAFVWLTLPDVAAQRLDGSVVANAYGAAGRVVVVGEEPLLEALHAPSNQVLLLQYAPPNSSIELQWTTNVAGGGWQPSPSVTQTNLVQAAEQLTPSLPALFFRALRRTSEP